MQYPILNTGKTRRQWVEAFTGLDRRPRAGDGAFSAMGNLTGEPWPLVSSRRKRGVVARLDRPLGLMALDKLCWIDGPVLYYDGRPTPIDSLSLAADMLPKRMVALGAYVVVFPDGVYYNTADPSDFGSVDRLYETGQEQAASYTLCDGEGVPYPDWRVTVGPVPPADPRTGDYWRAEDPQGGYTLYRWDGQWTACEGPEPEGSLAVSETPPENPRFGDYWMNAGESVHALYRWSEEWVSVGAVYVKISAPGIGVGLKTEDGVAVSGIQYAGENEALRKQAEALNGVHIVQAVEENAILVTGVLDAPFTQTAGTVRADRKAPEMDWVTACGNRLWGCRYGEQDGETVNLIYASALGDFTNWQKFNGTSQDSYYVHVGSDGPFTGTAAHRGKPCFFKEGCCHLLYGDKPANYEMQTVACDGVQSGSERTLAAWNGALYYLGCHGPQFFESLPQPIGQALGDGRLTGGAAGVCGSDYYLSVQEEGGGSSLYVLDGERGVWHRQDDSRALAFAALGGEMYMLCENGMLYALRGTAGEIEPGDVTWFAETAAIGYEYPEHKYLGRFLIRMKLDPGAECRLRVQYDSDGIWHDRGAIRGTGRVKTCVAPIVPRRCEHMKVRLEGHGAMTLYGLAREITLGSDGR